jgi:hypothetical protein
LREGEENSCPKTQLIGWRSPLCAYLLDRYGKIEVAFALGAIKQRGETRKLPARCCSGSSSEAYAGSIIVRGVAAKEGEVYFSKDEINDILRGCLDAKNLPKTPSFRIFKRKGEIQHHREIDANRSQGPTFLGRLPVCLSTGETKIRPSPAEARAKTAAITGRGGSETILSGNPGLCVDCCQLLVLLSFLIPFCCLFNRVFTERPIELGWPSVAKVAGSGP